MFRINHCLLSASLVVALMVAAGCGGTAPESAPAPAVAATPEVVADADDADDADDDGHDHTAPHGGVLVELGDHFGYLEFVLEAETGTLTMYVLDGEAEKAVRVAHETVGVLFTTPEAIAARPFELRARENGLTGETVGDTSEFVLKHAAFVGLKAFEARVIEVVVRGQSFRDVALSWPDDPEQQGTARR